ncbi:MAG TPA: hypothetical protein VJJ55_02270 [Candidatus Paceibacterota bacterium]
MVIHIAVDIAVLALFLHFILSGYTHATCAAPEKATERLRLYGRLLRMSALHHNLLRFIKQPLLNDWRVPSFVDFTAIAKMSVVKRIGENPLHAILVKRISVQASHTVLNEKL